MRVGTWIRTQLEPAQGDRGEKRRDRQRIVFDVSGDQSEQATDAGRQEPEREQGEHPPVAPVLVEREHQGDECECAGRLHRDRQAPADDERRGAPREEGEPGVAAACARRANAGAQAPDQLCQPASTRSPMRGVAVCLPAATRLEPARPASRR